MVDEVRVVRGVCGEVGVVGDDDFVGYVPFVFEGPGAVGFGLVVAGLAWEVVDFDEDGVGAVWTEANGANDEYALLTGNKPDCSDAVRLQKKRDVELFQFQKEKKGKAKLTSPSKPSAGSHIILQLPSS